MTFNARVLRKRLFEAIRSIIKLHASGIRVQFCHTISKYNFDHHKYAEDEKRDAEVAHAYTLFEMAIRAALTKLPTDQAESRQ